MKVIYSGERQPRMVVLTQVRSREAEMLIDRIEHAAERSLGSAGIPAKDVCATYILDRLPALRELLKGIADEEGKG